VSSGRCIFVSHMAQSVPWVSVNPQAPLKEIEASR